MLGELVQDDAVLGEQARDDLGEVGDPGVPALSCGGWYIPFVLLTYGATFSFHTLTNPAALQVPQNILLIALAFQLNALRDRVRGATVLSTNLTCDVT